MSRTSKSLRAAILAALVGAVAAPAAFAQSAYTITPLSGQAYALSANGSIIGDNYTNVTSYCASCGWGGEYVNTNTNEYYLTGANGVGSTDLGGVTLADYQTGTNVLNITSNYVYPAGYNSALPSFQAAGGTTSVYQAPQITSVVGLNNSGAFVANVNMQGDQDQPYEGAFVAIHNSDSSVTYIGGSANAGGMNAAGAVSYNVGPVQTYTGSTQSGNYAMTTSGGSVNYLAAGSVTPHAVTDLGYGGVAGGLNSYGQITGGLYTGVLSSGTYNPVTWGFDTTYGTDYTEAFRTGADGTSTQLLGFGPGVSSMGTAINDTGQVGGYVTLASGQTEAFLTDTSGSLMVGLGTLSPTDSTEVLFLNDSGEAIVEDTTADVWYLYDAGVMIDVASLSGMPGDPVIGFNDAGQILLEDPDLLSVSNPSGLTPTNLLAAGGFSDTSTQAYTDFVTGTGQTPGSSFFSDPSAGGNTSAGGPPDVDALGGSSSGSSVPEPGVFGLAGFGALLLALVRRRKLGGVGN